MSEKQEIIIAVERAGKMLLPKPWGSKNLLPWIAEEHNGEAIGELWFRRTDEIAQPPTLLIKLLFTSDKLSIQVHPDNAFAQSIGLLRGKTEAWYILSASSAAQVALGLRERITKEELRASIENGSVSKLVRWHHVKKGDFIFVPAGTIHAIGPGLVIAEIQQNSDATFRMFDYGRQRELHIDNAVAVADAGPAGTLTTASRLTDARSLLVACPYFVVEHIKFAPNSVWEITAASETWLLVLEGNVRVAGTNVSAGEAFFLQADRVTIASDAFGSNGLVAYVAAKPRLDLLADSDQTMETRP